MFTDAKFMSAEDKALVLRDWERFLQHGLKRQYFSRRLYEHLHLHCGFIAHYDPSYFHFVYFEAGQDIERFFDEFCSYTDQNSGACTPNTTICIRHAGSLQRTPAEDHAASRAGRNPQDRAARCLSPESQRGQRLRQTVPWQDQPDRKEGRIMKEFCQNQYCDNPGAKVVPVSVERPSDATDPVRTV